jgi:hypothetical protein
MKGKTRIPPPLSPSKGGEFDLLTKKNTLG